MIADSGTPPFMSAITLSLVSVAAPDLVGINWPDLAAGGVLMGPRFAGPATIPCEDELIGPGLTPPDSIPRVGA